VQLHLHEWGDADAPAVVCLHGVQAHGRRFRRLAEERLAPGHRVLAPDLRGHGHSGWEEPWTIAAHLADLLESVGQRGAWIGHSFGGRLVAELMAVSPDLVERAVFLDPALTVPPDYAQVLAQQELAADESFASPEEAVQATFAGLLRRPTEVLEEEVREHLVLGEDGRYRFRYSRDAVSAAYLEVALPPSPWERQGIPTLIVAGVASKFVSVGEVEVYRDALDDELEVVVVPGGHSVLWDAFDETADAIERFLASAA
jgi:lipase